MQPDKQQNDDAALDRLLGEASWAEPRADQIGRLERQWLALNHRQPRSTIHVAAIAATLLLAVGLGLWGASRLRSNNMTLSPKKSPDSQEFVIEPSKKEQSEMIKHDSTIESADPNNYQQVVLAGVFPKRQLIGKTSTKSPRKVDLEPTIAALSQDGKAEIAAQLVDISRKLDRNESALWTIIQQSNGARRVGATRLLARIATVRSVPMLVELLDDSETHEAATAGIVRLADPQTLARLAGVEFEPDLKQQYLAALASRSTEESVGLFLGFVRDPVTRSAALDAVQTVERPPVNLLLWYLESQQTSLRLAAAQALGRLPRPEVVRGLVDSALSGSGRQEALVALLLNPAPESVGFLNQARQQLYLVASVQAAEKMLHTLQ